MRQLSPVNYEKKSVNDDIGLRCMGYAAMIACGNKWFGMKEFTQFVPSMPIFWYSVVNMSSGRDFCLVVQIHLVTLSIT
jgi:hypothetical protein